MAKLDLPEEKFFIGPALIWKRILAFLIDFAIMLFVLTPLTDLLGNAVPKDASFSEAYKLLLNEVSMKSYPVFVYLFASILIFIYFYKLESKYGQTIGKKLMNIYVVSTEDKLKKWQCIVRGLMFIPIFPFDLLILVDPLVMFATKTNQRLSEILSKTRVVGMYSYNH